MHELVFKKIAIEDKELFDKFFHEYPPNISEYTFTNLYVWKNSRQIEFSQYEEGLIILAHHENSKYFLPPIGFRDNKKTFDFLLNYGLKNNLTNSIKRADENYINQIKDLNVKITEEHDNFDYVYNTDDLAFLKGRKYSAKRNFITQFLGEYFHKYWQYTLKCKEKCLELTETWFKERANNKSLINEYNAIKELLLNFEKFDAIGGVLCAEDSIAGYCFGEKLNKDTFVIHFEKADSKFNGGYQAINKFFVENQIMGKYKYVNREQDLGIAGIRKAKKSYYPCKMIKKYTISI